MLSFVVAGISAILSTLCYSEFAVRFPLSGGCARPSFFHTPPPPPRPPPASPAFCRVALPAPPNSNLHHHHHHHHHHLTTTTTTTTIYKQYNNIHTYNNSAFNYLLFSCGELVAFCCVCTLVLEYVLANAAVARSFAPYLGQLVGKGSGFFTFPVASEPSRRKCLLLFV